MPSQEILEKILANYMHAMEGFSAVEESAKILEEIRKETEMFECALSAMIECNKDAKWAVSGILNISSIHRCAKGTLIAEVIPLAGLQIMASLLPEAFDVSLLEY